MDLGNVYIYGAIVTGILALLVGIGIAVWSEDDPVGKALHILIATFGGALIGLLWPLAVLIGPPWGIAEGVRWWCRRPRRPKVVKPKFTVLEPSGPDDPLCTCPSCGLLACHEVRQDKEVDAFYCRKVARRTCIFDNCRHTWTTPA